MSMLDDARKYLANGWSVFPIPYGKKEPIIKWGQFRERYATDEELIAWFGTGQSNIGIACGKLSNLTVLDADGETGVALLGTMALVSTGTVITGSGGKQLFYRHSGETNKWTSENHEGLDSRGEGGYVVAPPSLHPNGRTYRWVGSLPNASALNTFPPNLFPQGSTGTNTVPASSDPWLLDALAGVRLGKPRHGTLVRLVSYYAPRHPLQVVEHLMLEWNKKNDEPYPEGEVVKQVKDIMGRFTNGTYKSTFVMPKEQEQSNVKESLEISTPSADADAYYTNICTTPAPPELPLGFATLDEATWGLHRGDVFTIGARPGTGKTTFAINVAAHLCKAGKRVLYFSTEMSKEEMYNAISASQGGVDAFRLTNKQLNADDKRKLASFLPSLKAYDIHHVKFFTPDQSAVSEAVTNIKPDLLVIDHLQHIASGDNKYHQLDQFVKFLKRMAMEQNIAVLCTSQLRRIEDGALPDLHHLKECGTIEEESSIVILAHKEKKNEITTPVLFKLAKNRHGRCGDTTLLFEGTTTTFKDMSVKVA